MSDPVDVSRLSQLCDGMPGGMRGLVELFISHTSEAAGHLRAALEGRRFAEVHALAHQGVGTAGAIGADRLMGLFRRLESAAKESSGEGVDHVAPELERELASVHRFLAALIDRPPQE